MKLYATTTSERASKGQGGNQYINIDLFSGDAKNSLKIASILLDASSFIYIKDGQGKEKAVYMATKKQTLEDVTAINSKGEKQKGE